MSAVPFWTACQPSNGPAMTPAPKAWISTRIGGDQIDYADETTEVRSMFENALAENGLSSMMAPAYEAEKPDLPPRPGEAA